MVPADAPPAIVDVIGGRHIGEAGGFDGVWITPDFLPQPAFAGVDLHVWLLLGGYVNTGEFVSRRDRFTPRVELDSQGNHRHDSDVSGETMLRVYTPGQFVPGGVRVHGVSGVGFIADFDAVSPRVDINLGSESMAFEWTFRELGESCFQMKQLLANAEAAQDDPDGRSAMTDSVREPGNQSPEPAEQPRTPPPPPPDPHERFLGSMVAGALGDALDYGTEFQPIEMIRRTRGEQGVTGPVTRDGVAEISDDTQMVLFTLEGLIRAHVARRIRPVDNDPVPEVQLRALDAATRSAGRGVLCSEELIAELGEGWTGEEALATGLYAVLATDNLRDAVLVSVNHSGDSDPTGIVCGTIAGAVHGARGIPQDWPSVLELHDVIEALSRDVLAELSPEPPTGAAWTRRYPAW